MKKNLNKERSSTCGTGWVRGINTAPPSGSHHPRCTKRTKWAKKTNECGRQATGSKNWSPEKGHLATTNEADRAECETPTKGVKGGIYGSVEGNGLVIICEKGILKKA